MTDECLIWKTPATFEAPNEQTITANSPRAGGKYSLTHSVEGKVISLHIDKKLVLTTWLCDQRRLGVEVPALNSFNVDQIVARAHLPFSQRVERTLLFLAEYTRRPIGSHFQIYAPQDVTERVIAESESLDSSEFGSLLRLMMDMGLLKGNPNTNMYQLSPQGWIRVEELSRHAVDTSQGFVAMWFDDKLLPAWKEGIEPAITDAGYKPLRIDNVEHTGKVDDRIIAEIRRSRFLVADFSCESGKPRGGVYYEAGFAEGLNIPIFWTVRKESVNELHFDTRQYNHIVWASPAELREKLGHRIRSVLGQGPLKPTS